MGASCGTILGALKLKDAILLAYDTRVHKDGVVLKVRNKATGELEEVKVPKVYLAQYCALAGAGSRKFFAQIHSTLLNEVTEHLGGQVGAKQISVDGLVEIISKSIADQVQTAKNVYEKNKTKANRKRLKRAEKNRRRCGLILGTWEMNKDGEYIAKLKKFRGGEYVDESADCCLLGGGGWVLGQISMENEYKEDMSVNDGMDLLVRGIQEVVDEDNSGILGGDVEVLVLRPRDIQKLPLLRREQGLDRAITFFNKGALKEKEEEEEEQAINKRGEEEQRPKKRRKLVKLGDKMDALL